MGASKPYIDSNTRAVIYHVSKGKVDLGKTKEASAAKVIGDFASSGRKDREANTGYDNYVRAKKIVGVADAVGYHYTESRAISRYNKLDFNDQYTKSVLKDLGYGRGNEISNSISGDSKIVAMRNLASSSEKKIKELAGLDKFSIKKATKVLEDAKASGNTALATELEKHINFYKKNELSEEISSGHRAYGRDLIHRYYTGEDMSRGRDFYKLSGKVTVSTARFATKAAANTMINIGTSAPVHTVISAVTKATGTDKFQNSKYINGTRADRKQIRKDLKDNVSNHIRKKSHAEKVAIRREKRQANLFDKQKRLGNDMAQTAKTLKTLEKKGLGQTAEATKLRNKLNFQKQKQSRLNFRRNLGNRARNSKVFKAGRKVTAITRGIYQYNPINMGLKLFNKAKVFAFKAVGGAILVGALPILIVGMLSGVAGVLAHFMTAINPAAKLADALAAPNYLQLIINETTMDLASELQIAAQNDAERYYLIDHPVASDGLSWTRQVDEASVVGCYSTEKGVSDSEQLPGVSANLQAICSMAHKRFLGEINFSNYFTVKGYVYTMYVYSHDIERDASGNVVYSYIPGEECKDKIYEGEILTQIDRSVTPAQVHVTRPDELCSNVYVHGYSDTLNKAINNKRAMFGDFLSNSIKKLGISVGDGSNKANGVFVNEKPYDTAGVCDNYVAYKGSLKCGKAEHKHSEEGGSCYGEKANPKTGETYIGLTCTQEEHVHSPWISEDNPGCYDTIYVCKGHCGGHISPQVNIMEDMTYENLANHDNFIIPQFLTARDFSNTLSETAISVVTFGNSNMPQAKNYGTFEDWQKAWVGRVQSWKFTQFVKTPREWLTLGTRKFLTWFASTGAGEKKDDVEKFEGWQIDDGHGGKKYTSSFKDLKEIYGTYYDEDLNVLEEPYDVAAELWDAFEVTFPTGAASALTKSQIDSILKQIKAQNPGISAKELSVLQEALTEVGKWSYSLAGHANGWKTTGGITDCSGFVGGVIQRITGYNTSGMLAASYRGGTIRPGCALSHSNGGTGKSGIAYTGHVVLYLGYLPEGPKGYFITNQDSGNSKEQTGPGYYIVHCTSTYGGSLLQRYESKADLIRKYPNAFNY